MSRELKLFFSEINYQYDDSWEGVSLENVHHTQTSDVFEVNLLTPKIIKQNVLTSLNKALDLYFGYGKHRVLTKYDIKTNEQAHKFVCDIWREFETKDCFIKADQITIDKHTITIHAEINQLSELLPWKNKFSSFTKEQDLPYAIEFKTKINQAKIKEEQSETAAKIVKQAKINSQMEKINEAPTINAIESHSYGTKVIVSQIAEAVTHDFKELKILDVTTPEKIVVSGNLYSLDLRKLKTGSSLLSFSLVDENINAINAKTFLPKLSKDIEIIGALKKGTKLKVSGSWEIEKSFNPKFQSNEPVLLINKIQVIDHEETINNTKPYGEINIHTKMSAFDGVGEIEDYFKKAKKEGINTLGFTDINSVQSFPDIQKIAKDYPEIKVLYGVELEVLEKVRTFDFDFKEYIVFDLETTGLYPNQNEIIEFGAIHVKDGQIIDQKQFFIKPKKPVPAHITKITNITNEMVKDGMTEKEGYEEIKKFISDKTLIAHNGYDFDYKFLAALYSRHKDEITNPIIDSIHLFRSYKEIFKFKKFRLGSICESLKVEYNESAHRADYDAKVLNECLSEVSATLTNTLGVDWFHTDYAKKYFNASNRFANYGYQTLFFAQNIEGLKNLYQLVSIATTTNFVDKPVLYWSDIEKHRENLLIGATSFRGIAYDWASSLTPKDIEAAISRYDFVEITHPNSYLHLIDKKIINDYDSAKEIVKKIYEIAHEHKKLVIASGNVFYVNPTDKLIREIIINTKQIGGKLHYLFDYNNKVSPDAHLLTRAEFFNLFSMFNEKQIEELIHTNVEKLKSQITLEKPLSSKLYPPKLKEDTKKLVAEISWNKIIKIYGQEPNFIIKERYEKEISKLNEYEYNDIYYIAYLLVHESNKNDYIVGSRGSVGSSFVAWALNITEVNPLAPHYVCKCTHHEFVDENAVKAGFDLPPSKCPKCGHEMIGDGHNIPFETFLGFEGDKIPDIDLNFASDYQEKIHEYTRSLFGKENVYRAGTISTVASKTAYGYVMNYLEANNIKDKYNKAQISYLTSKCEGVKRSSGQHPGGIIIVPSSKSILDFTPYNFPADEVSSDWYTTHLEFEALHDNLLKLDLLGHADPQALKMLKDLTKVNPQSIPMNDEQVMKLFTDSKPFSGSADSLFSFETTGCVGIPEFGTYFVRSMLKRTKPNKFSDLVQISGLSHGTDVWSGNAEELIKNGLTLNDVISCRDDIMTFLIQKGLNNKLAFDIMEKVRKGKGLKPTDITEMRENNVPNWYIESAQKIKYMFPKAHAIAYTIMAWRLAWFKINYPLEFYSIYFKTRCDQFDVETIFKGPAAIKERFIELKDKYNKNTITPKESGILLSTEALLEMYARGFKIEKLDIRTCAATDFIINHKNHSLMIPLIALDGLGETVAAEVISQRNIHKYSSLEDFTSRSGVNKTQLAKLIALDFLHFD